MAASLTNRVSGDIDQAFADADALRPGSFDGIYNHYRPALLRFARREGAIDPEGVADLALFDGFRIFDQLRNRTDSAFRSYVYRAARSHIVAERRRPRVATVELERTPEPAGPEPEDLTDRLLVDSLLTQLTSDQRQVIEYRFLKDLSSADTAEILGKTPNAVNQLQHRAIARLRKLLFAGAVLTIVFTAIWVVSELSMGGGMIDNRPIDEPVIPTLRRETGTIESGGSERDAADHRQVQGSGSPNPGTAAIIDATVGPDMGRNAGVPPQRSTTTAPPPAPAVPRPTVSAPPSTVTPSTAPRSTVTPSTAPRSIVPPSTGPQSTTVGPDATPGGPATTSPSTGGAKAERKIDRLETQLDKVSIKGLTKDHEWLLRKQAKLLDRIDKAGSKPPGSTGKKQKK